MIGFKPRKTLEVTTLQFEQQPLLKFSMFNYNSSSFQVLHTLLPLLSSVMGLSSNLATFIIIFPTCYP